MSGFLEGANVGRFQDGIVGMAVGKGSSTNNVVVRSGIARAGGVKLERYLADEAVDIAVPAAAGAHAIYLNAPGALTSYPSGSALSMLSVDAFEGDKTRAAINGSVSTTFGRSMLLANITVTPSTGGVTFTGTWAAADTATITFDSEAIVTTFGSGDVASPTTVAAKAAATLNADATFATKAVASNVAGLLVITALFSTAFTLTATKSSTSGTVAASGATLTGGGIDAHTGIDNTVKLDSVGASYSTRVNAG